MSRNTSNKTIKDILYKYIEISDLALKFIDTYEFQRLRRIKQLSTSYLVYPSVCHTRFEHSVGVYHLTGLYLDYLNPDIDKRLREIIKLGGLLHDIGHMAFSHTFDNYIVPKLSNADYLKQHEDRSVELIFHMNEKYSIGLTIEELNILKSVILGEVYGKYPKYLFQIVSNKDNGIDVDKIDYLNRDSFYINNINPIEYIYIFRMSKIIDNQIVYDARSQSKIFNIFHTRFTLHNELYQHDVAVITEMMMKDLILENKESLKLEEIHKDFKWLEITDDIIYNVENKELLNRLFTRKLYKILPEYKQGCEIFKRKINYNSVDNFIYKIPFYTNKTETIFFYTKDNINKSVFGNIHDHEDEMFILK